MMSAAALFEPARVDGRRRRDNNQKGIFDFDSTVRRSMSFAEAADTIVSRSDGAYYLQQQPIRRQFPELLPDLPRPALLDESDHIEMINLWFGGAGCVTPLHEDSQDNLLSQILGTKRVTLFAPSDDEFLYRQPEPPGHHSLSCVNPYAPDLEAFPLFAQVTDRRRIAMLEPSDILFIPRGWWHAVETLSTPSPSISGG